MNEAETRLLMDFLDSPARPDGTLRYHELQGFLCAVASSPESIAPSEWLPIIGNDESLNFADENEAQKTLTQSMMLYNDINTAALERSNVLPSGCAFDDYIAANFDDDSSISQWSRGFAAGHDWLSEVWEEFLFDELDEEYGATLMVLSFFSSRQLAEAYYAETAPARQEPRDASFDDYAETMRKLFPDALASYANLGRTIFEVISKRSTKNNEQARTTKVGRNDPCPCGSGRKYKKCCGGRIH